MAAWKILLTDGLEESGQAILRDAAETTDRNGISAEELLQVVGEYDALIVRGRTRVNSAVLSAGTKLKVVGRAGVGVDNIDLAAARERKIAVVNAPLGLTIAVAELTLGLMLSMAREIPRADSGMKNGKWLKKELEGTEIYGKTLGVIGVGRIGSAVAQRAEACGMKVIGYDAMLKPDEIRQRGLEPVSLEELYSRSDIITVHTPLTNETRGMLGETAFEQMKTGVRLVCAARGGVIDEASLLAALNSGKVAFAGLDVFANEPPGLTGLVAHPHLICTPHIGAQTLEAQSRAAYDISSEVLAALRGESLRWKVA
jgi:D-3-phosphoglycerate dehydrogenase / 2-oxoglutarate reductase